MRPSAALAARGVGRMVAHQVVLEKKRRTWASQVDLAPM